MADATIQYLTTIGVPQGCSTAAAEFASPYTVAYDAGGRLYALDTSCVGGTYSATDVNSNRLQVYAADHTFLYTVEPNDGVPFWHPTGIAFDADGKFLVADWNDRIVLFRAATATAPPVEIASYGSSEDHDPLDSAALPGPAPLNPLVFWGAWSVAIKTGTHLQNPADTAGRVAVVDNGNHRVVVLDSMLKPMYDFGGHFAGDTDDPAGSLEYPQGVAIDSTGLYYVADTDNARIQVFREVVDAQGVRSAEFVRMFGSAIDELGRFGSSPGDLSRPRGITIDPQGRLWVTDADRDRLLRIDVGRNIDPAGLVACRDAVDYRITSVCYLATSDGKYYAAMVLGTLGGGTRAQFHKPSGVAVSHDGRIAVADTDNQVVQMFRTVEPGLAFAGTASAGAGPHAVNMPMTASVSMANTGGVDLRVTLTARAVNGDRPFAGTFGVLPQEIIAAGQTRPMSITFTPGEPGTFAWRIGATAVSADPNVVTGGAADAGILMIDGGEVLPGTGMSMTTSPTGGVVNVGDTLELKLQLRNTGLTPLTHVTPDVEILQGATLVTRETAPPPLSLPALGSAEVSFTYRLDSAGAITLHPSATAEYIDASNLPRQLTAAAADVHFTISSDSIAPKTTATLPPPSASGWYNSAVRIGLEATDNPGGSGVAGVFWRVVEDNGDYNLLTTPSAVVLREGIFHVAYYAVDKAGNMESANQLTLKIDTVAPTMGPPIVTSALEPQNGWYRTDPTITFVAGDGAGGSGVATLTPPIKVTTEGRNQQFRGEATDHAGNVSHNDAVVSVSLDKTPPQLSCSANGGGIVWPPNHKWVAWNPVVTVFDALSGGASFKLIRARSSEPSNATGDGNTSVDMTGWDIGQADTSGFVRAERSGAGVGRTYTLVYQAQDLAGNTATCSVSLVVPHDQRKK